MRIWTQFLFLAIGAGILSTQEALHAQFEMEYFQSETTRFRGLPFSDAVRVGNMLFLSGQIGVPPTAVGASPE